MTTLTLGDRQFEVRQRRSALLWAAIWREMELQNPMTVRQTFYRVESAGDVEKTEAGYRRVQQQILKMRRAGAIPYDWITDGTRWVHHSPSYDSMGDALDHWQRSYRRALWNEQPVCVEVWVEKDALAGVLRQVSDPYDVMLYVARGFSSETYVYECAQYLKSIDKPIFIYHFGDYDPSGRAAAKDIEKKLRGFGASFTYIEAAVTPQQIGQLHLPTRPTKTEGNAHAKDWIAEGKGGSVELDAIPPNTLRQMVRDCIERHIDPYALAYVRAIEEQERARFAEMALQFADDDGLADDLFAEFGTSTIFGGGAS